MVGARLRLPFLAVVCGCLFGGVCVAHAEPMSDLGGADAVVRRRNDSARAGILARSRASPRCHQARITCQFGEPRWNCMIASRTGEGSLEALRSSFPPRRACHSASSSTRSGRSGWSGQHDAGRIGAVSRP